VLGEAVQRLRRLARSEAERLRAELGAAEGNERDDRVVEEIFEENLDHLLRENEEFQSVADILMDEVERRFELLAPGTPEYTKQGWPRLWKWETQDRSTTTLVDAVHRLLRRFSHLAPMTTEDFMRDYSDSRFGRFLLYLGDHAYPSPEPCSGVEKQSHDSP
jgi:hypothetical protein